MATIVTDGHEFGSEEAWERIKDGPLIELAYVCDAMSQDTTGPTGLSYRRLAEEIRTLIQLRHGADRMRELRAIARFDSVEQDHRDFEGRML